MTKFRMVALPVGLGSVCLVVACMTPSEPDTTMVEGDLAAVCSSEHSEPNVYDAADFDHVFEDFEQQTQMYLVGHEWDNTLIRNCRIHGTPGSAIFIRDATNVVVHNCEVWNTGTGENAAIRLSSWGSGTQDVTIDGNHIHDVPYNGVWAGDASENHVGLKVINNVIERTGLVQAENGVHPIYLQSSDFFIAGNTISGLREGNGISIRSSGVVRCNNVSGTSITGRPAIRYFSDHAAGVSNELVIEYNTIDSDTRGIHLYPPVSSTSGSVPPTHVVKSFIIRNNVINAPTEIDIDSAYDNAPYSVTVE